MARCLHGWLKALRKRGHAAHSTIGHPGTIMGAGSVLFFDGPCDLELRIPLELDSGYYVVLSV